VRLTSTIMLRMVFGAVTTQKKCDAGVGRRLRDALAVVELRQASEPLPPWENAKEISTGVKKAPPGDSSR